MTIEDRINKLMSRSSDAMCEEQVWSEKDHKLLVETLDYMKGASKYAFDELREARSRARGAASTLTSRTHNQNSNDNT